MKKKKSQQPNEFVFRPNSEILKDVRKIFEKNITDPEYLDILMKHTLTLNPKKNAAKEAFEEVRDQLFLKSLRNTRGV